ncbi:hypothetical protein [Ruicaihuangia caeni]|uniref:DUF3558 domain-containing protein n=1 Tax=Ruicaihuangia caeni TaxID=3042517 RepID=A0AAW6T289_9MICO|nr:hypothetical protein [Klugiella sp. YN-L-19]MDI2097940.1 hypothetical protein [Klugiella sp. YN-L-19]
MNDGAALPRWRGALVAVGALALALGMTGCLGASAPGGPAADGGTPSGPPATIPAADGEVMGQGTVLQRDGETAMLCLGAVMESYPPQCSGPEIAGWDWSSVEGAESASGVTWGAYAVQGTWDGVTFTSTAEPIMLALYDPMVEPDPFLDPANTGASSDDELAAVQAELDNAELSGLLSSWPQNGYLFVHVVYDDGSLQQWVDGAYGADVVQVRSALRPIAG